MVSFNDVIILFIEIQIFTASGALAPGPLSIATFGSGMSHGWRAGLMASTGHLVAELPIFILIAYGILNIESVYGVSNALLIISSIYLLYLGYTHIKMENIEYVATGETRHPLLLGIIFTAFNPYFILWWVVIGSVFIYDSIKLLGFAWLPIVYISHVWMDYTWLLILSILADKGVTRFSSRYLRIINHLLGFILIFFGLKFVYDVLVNIV